MTQMAMFQPGSGGIEALIVRRDDPATSKVAARKVVRSGRMGNSLNTFLTTIRIEPMTCREAAALTDDPSFWGFEFNRRVKSWHVAGHIELTGEERDGSRVWRLAK